MNVFVLFIVLWVIIKLLSGPDKNKKQVRGKQQNKAGANADIAMFNEAVKSAEESAAVFAAEQATPDKVNFSAEGDDAPKGSIEGYESLEGQSLNTDDGCPGGSLAHDEHEHEGTEFHAEGAHGNGIFPREPVIEIPSRRGVSVTADKLREAVIMKEILDKPVSLRRR